MAPSLLTIAVLAIAATPISACNFHTRRSTTFSNPHTGTVHKRAEGEAVDFEYVNSFDWHTIKPEYATCHSGTSQSPINLHTSQGLAHTHTPDFAGIAAHGPTTGTFGNWGFGPKYTIDHEGTDFTTLPAMTFDNQTVHLSGWHIHFPSEHLVDGVRSRAEMHMVMVNAVGEPAAVVGVRIEPSLTATSAFFQQLPTPLIGFNDTATEVPGVTIDQTLAIQEVGNVREYWTYAGSLTTPPCSEGLRWFVPQQTLKVSQEQMVAMLGASRFSHRVEQVVWNQAVNV